MPELDAVESIYSTYARFYDWVFGPFFEQGQRIAVKMMRIEPAERILEVGIGTGALLPFYPKDIDLVGIDFCQEMLDRAVLLRNRIGMPSTVLRRMDATRMDFPDSAFDKLMAAYVISVVPDPVAVGEEMKRVCKKGGEIFFINHFRSENPLIGAIEGVLEPIGQRLGFSTTLDLHDLLEMIHLKPVVERSVNLFGLWRIVKCVNEK
ncbi:MAG: methyltransferase domain-containing protein [Candidatus Eisenbacteria bacterium]|nr:methyltransferase domain-containing protein [Candidatus Eisenbacteria bacterium]